MKVTSYELPDGSWVSAKKYEAAITRATEFLGAVKKADATYTFEDARSTRITNHYGLQMLGFILAPESAPAYKHLAAWRRSYTWAVPA